MPSTWDAPTEVKLLFNIIEQATVKPNWESIATGMVGAFSAEACRQHFGKMKRTMVEDGGYAPANGEAAMAVTPSPRKRKPKQPKTPEETPKRQRKTVKREPVDNATSSVKKEPTDDTEDIKGIDITA